MNKKIYLFLILNFLFIYSFSFSAFRQDVNVNINNQGFFSNQSYSGSINISSLDVLNSDNLNKILNLIINVNPVEQEIIASGDIYADPNPIIVDPGQTYASTVIYAKSTVDYDILVSSTDNIDNASIFLSNQPSTRLGITRNFIYVNYPTGNWVTNGMTFYLVKAGTREILDKVIIELRTFSNPSGDIYADPNPIIVDPGQTYASTVIYAKSTVDYDILVSSTDNIDNSVPFTLNKSPNNNYVNYPTGNWVTNGMTFYLVKAGTREILDKVIISFNQSASSVNLTINNQINASFMVGDSWILRIQTNPILANKSVKICAIKDGINLGCTYYGNTDSNGNWSLSGVFDNSVIGNWNEYAIIDDRFNSNSINFSVGINQNNQTSSQQAVFNIIPSSVNLLIGQYQQFRAYYDSDGNGPQPSQDVTNLTNWSSSNFNILSINNNTQKGLATANNFGSATIFASYNNLNSSAFVNVSFSNQSTSSPIPSPIFSPTPSFGPPSNQLINLMVTDDDYSVPNRRWSENLITYVNKKVFLKYTLHQNGQYTAAIWCNQNNSTLDYSKLPNPDYIIVSYYFGQDVILNQFCQYNSSGTYYIKLLVGFPALNSSNLYQDMAMIQVINVNNPPTNPPVGSSPSTPPPPQKHLECNSLNQCVEVNGPGPNRCNISSDCGPTNFAGKCELQNGAKFCVNKRCNPAIPGDCISECKNDSDCGTNPPPSTHLECYNNACVIISGSGQNQCSVIGPRCQGVIKEINPTFPKINPPSIFDFLRNTASIFFTRIK